MKNLKKMMLSALLFSATTAVAEPFWVNKPLQCGTLEDIVETSKVYGEKPSILFEGRTITQTGEFSSSKFIIATNEETKTWTLIEFPAGSDVGCILGRGDGLVRLLGQGESI